MEWILYKNCMKHSNKLTIPTSIRFIALANKCSNFHAWNYQLTIFRIISVIQFESRWSLKNSVSPKLSIIRIDPVWRYSQCYFLSQRYIVIMDVILHCSWPWQKKVEKIFFGEWGMKWAVPFAHYKILMY